MAVPGHDVILAMLLSGRLTHRRIVAFLEDIGARRTAGIKLDLAVTKLTVSSEDAAALRKCVPEAALIRERAGMVGARTVVFGEPEYPRLLKEIAVPPPVLFCRGSLAGLDNDTVAIVGSRRASLAGIGMARRLGQDLAGMGFTVVSGLARGIDTAAHDGALEAGGHTVAVLGCGIDVVYPAENRRLADAIASSGALITELWPGTRPLRQNFPRRNRIISGLALGTVVVEAGGKSGALITADFALEQNRYVFAVPGYPGYSGSEGTNRLLKDGAVLVESAQDVIRELAPQLRSGGTDAERPQAGCDMTPDEERLIGLLSGVPAHIDELSRNVGLRAHETLHLLVSLESRGLVRSMPGKFYVLEART